MSVQERDFSSYAKAQARSFLTGACIGGVVSGSFYGAAWGGCLNLVFQHEEDITTQVVAVSLFAAMKYVIHSIDGPDYLISLTPIFIAGHNRKYARDLSFTVIGLIGMIFIEKILLEKQSGLRTNWPEIAATVDEIFEYQMGRIIGFLCIAKIYEVFFQEMGKSLVALDVTRRIEGHVEFFLTARLKFMLALTDFLVLQNCNQMVEYLKVRSICWITPMLLFGQIISTQLKLFVANEKRASERRTILPKNHPIEIQRELELINADTDEEEMKIENAIAERISRF